MKPLALLLVSLTAIPCLASKKERLIVTAQSYRVIPHNGGLDIPVYGSVDTTCYGDGSSWNYNVNCSSYVYPPGDIPINVSWVEVYNEVAARGILYTLRCISHWRGSSCDWMHPGSQYTADLDRDHAWIYGYAKGRPNKIVAMKLYIADEVCASTGKHLAQVVPRTNFWKYKAPKLPEPGSTSVCPN